VSSDAVAHPPESRGLWPGATDRLMARLGQLWALRKKGKREAGWAVCGRKEKGSATGPLRGRKGDSPRGTLGK
jgi:hypothetical protein